MSIEISRIKALCFDIDGTLRDTDDHFVAQFSRILRLARFLFPRRDPRPFARWVVTVTENPVANFYQLYDRLGLDNRLEKIENALYRLRPEKKLAPEALIPGVREMLKSLRPHFPMAVVTARGDRVTQHFLEQFELSRYFQTVVTAHTCHYTKPSPDPLIYAARQMGVDPQECLMVGDTTADILAGRAAGTQTVGVLCGFGQRGELEEAGADQILEKTTDVVSILLKEF